jgi:hypothetical protein
MLHRLMEWTPLVQELTWFNTAIPQLTLLTITPCDFAASFLAVVPFAYGLHALLPPFLPSQLSYLPSFLRQRTWRVCNRR